MRAVPLAVLQLVACAAEAHHSAASFDQGVEVLVEGTVTDVLWANPHVYFSVETVGPGGERVVQQVEAAPLSGLATFGGVTRDSLRVGDRVRVRANPNRRGAGRVALGIELTTAVGAVLPLHPRAARSSSSAAFPAATSILGTWVGQPEGFLALVAAIRSWPLTQRASRRSPATAATSPRPTASAFPRAFLES